MQNRRGGTEASKPNVQNEGNFVLRLASGSALIPMYYMYLTKCEDGSIYTGITTDIARRFKEHQSGMGGHHS